MWNINLESFTKTSVVRVSRGTEVCASKCLAAKMRSFQLSICMFLPTRYCCLLLFFSEVTSP